MIRLSTGLRASMLWSWGFTAMMQGGHIRLYSGPQPARADLPPTGALLGYISADGLLPQAGVQDGGLHFALTGAMLTDPGNWRITGTATGVAGWWRMVWNDYDPQTESNYYPRIDGAVGESLLLADPHITPATRLPVARFQLLFPFE